MKKKIIFLAGGLGNQLFQLSYALSTSLSGHCVLNSEVFYNARSKDDKPELFEYDLPPNFVLGTRTTPRIIQRLANLTIKFSTKTQLSLLQHVFCFTSSVLLKFYYSIVYRTILRIRISKGVGFDSFESKHNELAIGYFQSYRWLLNNSNAMKEIKSFVLKNESDGLHLYQELAKSESPLAVHIRLGDYFNEPDIGVLPAKYYEAALSFHFKNTTYGKIWLFSNDPNFALTYFPTHLHEKIRVIEDYFTSAETLEIMKLAKGFIIANSTFSWWAANLAKNESALVVCPQKWFKRAPDPVDLLPPGWHRLPSFGTT